jgi:hypothetical protein
VVTSNKAPSSGQPASHRGTPMSRGRRRLLCSTLSTYGHGLVAFAVVSALFPAHQPPAWVRVSEIGLAMIFLALAFFIAPNDWG